MTCIEISKGNRKLGKDTIIFNMTSAFDCPSARLGLCKLGKRCYALKAEKLYPGCLPYRRRQADYWKSHSALEIASDILAKVKRMRVKPDYLRLSEAGDFESQADVDKAELIAMHLKRFGIQTYTYSARSDLDFSGCVALLVKGSSHNGGNNGKTIARKANVIAQNSFAGRYGENGEVFNICPMDCKQCDYCKTDKGINIVFPLH